MPPLCPAFIASCLFPHRYTFLCRSLSHFLSCAQSWDNPVNTELKAAVISDWQDTPNVWSQGPCVIVLVHEPRAKTVVVQNSLKPKMFGMSPLEVSCALHYHSGSRCHCHDKCVFTGGQKVIYVFKHRDFPNYSLKHIPTNPKCSDVLLDMERPIQTQPKPSILSCCLDDFVVWKSHFRSLRDSAASTTPGTCRGYCVMEVEDETRGNLNVRRFKSEWVTSCWLNMAFQITVIFQSK